MHVLTDLVAKGYDDVEVTVITLCGENLVADEIEEVAYDGNSNVIEIFGCSAHENEAPIDEVSVDEDDDPVGEDPGLLVS